MKMLILRGKAGYYEGRDWPRGALHEQPAGYDGQMLDIAGTAYRGSPQHKLALEEIPLTRNYIALAARRAGIPQGRRGQWQAHELAFL